eukprot:1158341-Pelagomonas_calceolata.AAC.3
MHTKQAHSMYERALIFTLQGVQSLCCTKACPSKLLHTLQGEIEHCCSFQYPYMDSLFCATVLGSNFKKTSDNPSNPNDAQHRCKSAGAGEMTPAW